jgi:chromosomal replication initiator protein
MLWDGVLHRLGADMPDHTLEAWIRPLVARSEGERLCLLCPTPFHRERVRERFLARITRCVEQEAGRTLEVELALNPSRTQEAAGGRPGVAGAPEADGSARGERSASPHRPTLTPVQRALPCTFENFVVGPCNALAREACYAVARGRQRPLTLLYLTAKSGLGKTHLARAIVEEARGMGRERVLYGSAEAFTNDFMSSIRTRRMDHFKRRYRQRCDLFVLEDVQFLRAKKATQLEIFHTLTHLLDVGARVVLTADRLPREMDELEQRLRSQMSAGFVAELEPPNATVRREILRAKAAAGGVHLPADCLQLLTESVRGSVRDLEGVLIQLVASASLLKRKIDLELTRAALHKLAPASARARRLEPGAVIEAVAAFFRTRPERLASRSRRRDALLPRQLAMYLCRRYTDAPLASIGRALGRDHPAVSNAVKKIERRILESAPLRYRVEALCARLDALEREGTQ